MCLKAKVIDYEDKYYAICNYQDLDGYNTYGYLNTLDIDDINIDIREKVALGDEIEVEEIRNFGYEKYLSATAVKGNSFKERVAKIMKYDSIKCRIVKLTQNGAIANVFGIPSFVRGNFEVGQEILATIMKINQEDHFILLDLDATMG